MDEGEGLGQARCPYGCGARMVGTELAEHMGYQCGRRPVVCGQCGVGEDKYLWADELELHLAQVCGKRVVGCPLQCEGEVMARVMVFTNVLEGEGIEAGGGGGEGGRGGGKGARGRLLPPNGGKQKKPADELRYVRVSVFYHFFV